MVLEKGREVTVTQTLVELNIVSYLFSFNLTKTKKKNKTKKMEGLIYDILKSEKRFLVSKYIS